MHAMHVVLEGHAGSDGGAKAARSQEQGGLCRVVRITGLYVDVVGAILRSIGPGRIGKRRARMKRPVEVITTVVAPDPKSVFEAFVVWKRTDAKAEVRSHSDIAGDILDVQKVFEASVVTGPAAEVVVLIGDRGERKNPVSVWNQLDDRAVQASIADREDGKRVIRIQVHLMDVSAYWQARRGDVAAGDHAVCRDCGYLALIGLARRHRGVEMIDHQ